MMKTNIAAAPMASEMAPALTASAPSSAPTVRCSSRFSLRGQSAGAQQQGQLGGAFRREVAGDDARTAR